MPNETTGVKVSDNDVLFTDNTDGDVSTTAHGYAPKAPNDATKKLDGTGAYSLPTLLSIPASAPTVAASQLGFSVNTGTNKLVITLKYADGTAKTAEISLT